MPTVVTSKHLQGATELTLIADIKSGFVPIPDPTSYASRLRSTLEFLFQARQGAVERDGLVGNAGPLEKLRSLHFVHWSIHDQDRKLLLAVSFDGPWEPYIRAIVDEAGPILDIIFSHCEGYEGNSCFDGYQKFSDWVRQRQIGVDFFYAGAPDVSVDDIRYLRDFERKYASAKRREAFEVAAAKLRVLEPAAVQPEYPRVKALFTALFRLGRLFPPAAATQSSGNDEFLFGRVAALLSKDARSAVFGSNGQPRGPVSIPPNSQNQLEALAFKWAEGLTRFEPKAFPLPAEDPSDPLAIQGNVLSGYEGMTHGCLLLARFEGATAAREFVRTWAGRLDTEAASDDALSAAAARADFPIAADTKLNLALTLNGLAVLGLSRDELGLLPKEFQEGPAARAGMLGDIGRNHPDRWERLLRNFPRPSQPAEELPLSCVDLVLIVQRRASASEGDHLFSDGHPLFADVKALGEESGIEILHVQPLRSYEGGHLGLTDGLSQPRHRKSSEPGVAARDRVALGELLLGYKNERDERVRAAQDEHAGSGQAAPALPLELLHNSTYLVLRKMSLDVTGFNAAMADARLNSGLSPEAFKTLLLGRKPDGASLLEAKSESANDFDYSKDPEGAKCPFSSHVRRANPREARAKNGQPLLPPRIVRRGMSYGSLYEHDPESSERGLLFMAYAASIAEQYEVIQRWVNGGNSGGGASAHPDLLAGTFPERPSSDRLLSFWHEGQLKKVAVPQSPFSALRWALYLFVPSLTALEFLVRREQRPHAPVSFQEPRAIERCLAELADLERRDPHLAALEWKRLLEDRDQRPRARELWQYVRDNGGALRTPYGVLVGSAEGVRAVLAEHETFSVRRYWTRMQSTFGEHYLGMDPEPQPLIRTKPDSGAVSTGPVHAGDFDPSADDYERYLSEVPSQAYERASQVPNRFANDISRQKAYACALALTKSWFQHQPRINGSNVALADFPTLAREVVYGVAAELFGLPGQARLNSAPEMPSAGPPARCPVDFQRVSQFIFHPRPSLALGEVARQRGKVVLEQLTEFVNSPESASAPFCKYYREKSPALAETGAPVAPALSGVMAEVSALTGLINGFAVPTSASFLSVLSQWLDSQQLWRLQRWLYGKTTEDDALREKLMSGGATEQDLRGGPLLQGVVEALSNAPVPDLLHRVATGERKLGDVVVTPGDRVVVSLGSAVVQRRQYADPEAWALLFGGDSDLSDHPTHACPGQKMAIGVLLGMLVGVLMQRNLSRVDKFTLRFEPSV